MNIQQVTTKEQLEDAFTVRRTVFVDEQQVPEEEEIDQFEDEATHIVLYDENIPVGAARIRVIDGIGKLERICVLSSARNKGAGKLLVNKLEEIALAEGVSKFKLNAQTHAIPFYERLGYETVSDVFLDAGIPHVTMVKQHS
ncbi:GNAT family N-acetyltransferase [Metabacillus malikii]|uniref:GNAT family N-acyltransferase n=1 Tax=Metabacillus malikii TaxID=1504265 RepID=A0ABT9ZEI0_9BACI|nr:GNAT family N-acetyltransferase [Metabacillus malikii]MDQ0230656.1 putative GNAT family N-acyltransferase [Metabacillus malikii]